MRVTQDHAINDERYSPILDKETEKHCKTIETCVGIYRRHSEIPRKVNSEIVSCRMKFPVRLWSLKPGGGAGVSNNKATINGWMSPPVVGVSCTPSQNIRSCGESSRLLNILISRMVHYQRKRGDIKWTRQRKTVVETR